MYARYAIMITESIKEQIRGANDIVDVISEYVSLNRKNKALCPFHQEKTPSFYVYPKTQSFYCFGCGIGGDVFTFVQEINKITFSDAVCLLAKRAGIPIPEGVQGKSILPRPKFR